MKRSAEVEAFADEIVAGFMHMNPVVLIACNQGSSKDAVSRGALSPELEARLNHLAQNYAALILDLEFFVAVIPDMGPLEVVACNMSALVSEIVSVGETFNAEAITNMKKKMLGERPLHPKYGYPICK